MEKKLPFVTLETGGKSYMLRLTALSAIELEKSLSCSVYGGMERLSELKVVIEFLYALLKSFDPDITRSTVCMIYDDYISEGGSLRKMNNIIEKALDCSGFFDFGEDIAQQKN